MRLLGPVEVWAGDSPVRAGEPRRLAVLAALAVDAGQVVNVATLVDRVWGDDPPAQAVSTLRAYVTRIRRVMEQTDTADKPVTVVSQAGGYRLAAGRDQVDLLRFRDLVEQAGGSAESDVERVRLLRQAMDLWQGEPLGGVGGDWAARVREQLTGERLAAAVAWAEAELAVGNASSVVARLAALAAEHPLMEPLVVAHVRALATAGRPTEALEQCRLHRVRLADEYGTDQGPQLRGLYDEILRGDTHPDPVAASDRLDAGPARTSDGEASVGVVNEAATDRTGDADVAVTDSLRSDDRAVSAPMPAHPLRRVPRRPVALAVTACVVLAIVVVAVWHFPHKPVPTTLRRPYQSPERVYTAVEEFTGDALNQAQWATPDMRRENGSVWSPERVRIDGGELQLSGVGRNSTGQGNMSGAACWCREDGGAPVRMYGIWEAKAKFDVGSGYGVIMGLFASDDSGKKLTMVRVNDAERRSMYPEMNDRAGHNLVAAPVAGDFTDWTVYGVEWRPTFFTFSLNGRIIFDSRKSKEAVQVPDVPMYFYVQMVSGPDGPVPGPDQTTPSTVVSHVDWVRYAP